ncbi:MAG: hypothetical protein ACQEW9_03575 [Bacteroidota bacterium]|uniref:Uncharacterized protein n=1 Tax=Algoriphagus faecimaris TaxID=686796 RepID=A0A1G6PY63_9BACT|nr:hypothetical protein [Algoriphagus faecimaris]SDC85063.1 hypothetical protein SAMN04488104_1007114 [Algoriphagus faecimaris]
MDKAVIQKELHQLIDGADEELLKLVYSILLPKDQLSDLPREQLKKLEIRYERHIKNPNEGKSLDEVKASFKK